MNRVFLHSLAFFLALAAQAGQYEPAWADVAPQRTLPLETGADVTPTQRGAALVKAVEALVPGDCLVIASGTYSVDRMWDVRVSGTAEAPIWILSVPPTSLKAFDSYVHTLSAKHKTVPVGVVTELVEGDVYHWGPLMAGALLGSLPVAFVYSFFVEYYVSGMTGSVKE